MSPAPESPACEPPTGKDLPVVVGIGASAGGEDHCGGIILSGTGSDGTQGILAVKAAGGFTIAQSPESAKYDGMPKSAIQTGAVDYVLSPQEIAAKLCQIIEEGGRGAALHFERLPAKPFQAILELVRRRKRVDFTQYKPNTLTRRIKRRLGALHLSSMEDYFDYLRKNPAEVDILYRDLTISVTSFFRDAAYFRSLTRELTRYLKARRPNEVVRAWSAGCSTGEEAYSLAIVIHDVLEKLAVSDVAIQIFATDINEAGMEFARKGVYSPVSVEGVPRALVRRYFDDLDGKYRVKKFIREMVVFARHDLTTNAPFMKMDLICCRNVFIYFAPHIQERIFKIFHYSLNTKGMLFLGKSESVSVAKAYFDTLDTNAKIFERAAKAPAPEVYFSSLPPRPEFVPPPSQWPAKKEEEVERLEAAVRALVPDSVIVDADFNVLEIAGAGRDYLELRSGRVGKAIDKLIIGPLKSKVLTLLHRAKRGGQITKGFNFTVAQGKRKTRVIDVIVFPFKTEDGARFAVSFSPVLEANAVRAGATNSEARELEQELTATREHLQTVIEEQETSNEELQALNEELQSTNEELQSTNEELETSNEELQSANEELTTLNEEMSVKTGEVMSLYGQVHAIQNSIRSPLLVVDRNMNLMRYNEPAAALFSIDAAMVEKGVYMLNEAPRCGRPSICCTGASGPSGRCGPTSRWAGVSTSPTPTPSPTRNAG